MSRLCAGKAWSVKKIVESLRRHRVLLGVALALALAATWVLARRVVGAKVEVTQARTTEMVQSVVTTGRVRPLRVRLAPLATGMVREILVHEGARVVAGQLLLQLDDEEAKAALSNAEALLAQAQQGQRKLKTVTRAEAEETLTQAQARVADASLDLKRVQLLFDADAVTQSKLQDAQTTEALAQSALRSAMAQKQDVQQGGPTVRNSEAAIEQARANVALAQARLNYMRLVAPSDGIVIARNAEVGDSISANTIVLELAATSRTELVVEPDERNLSLLQVGQHALASSEAFPEQRFEAELHFIAPVIDSRRGTVEVRLLVADPPDYLRPDMTVSVDIEVDRKPAAMVVPIASVVGLSSSSPHLFLVEGGKVQRRDVTIGIRDLMHVEVVSGLSANEQLILNPVSVSEGDRVRAVIVEP